MTNPRIAFMGAGAIGSYLGAYMTQAGYAPALIDPWPEHVEKMKADGVRASGSQGDFTVPVNAMHLTEVQSVREPFDIVFVAMKSYDTEWATHFIKRYLSPTGFVVLCAEQHQRRDDRTHRRLRAHRGPNQSSITVHLVEPGHVVRGAPPGRDRGYDVFRVGELKARSRRGPNTSPR